MLQYLLFHPNRRSISEPIWRHVIKYKKQRFGFNGNGYSESLAWSLWCFEDFIYYSFDLIFGRKYLTGQNNNKKERSIPVYSREMMDSIQLVYVILTSHWLVRSKSYNKKYFLKKLKWMYIKFKIIILKLYSCLTIYLQENIICLF